MEENSTGINGMDQEVRQEVTERERVEEVLQRSLEEAAYSHQLLLALSRAAQSVQRARTPDEVYQIVGDQVVGLGFHAIMYTLTEDQTHLVLAHHTFDSSLLRVAERIVGISAQGFSVELVPGSHYDQVVLQGKTIFYEQLWEAVAQTLPQVARPLLARILAMFGLRQAIYAPLRVGGETSGLLVVSGVGMTEADIPAVTVFANQAAIALENARLYQELQQRAVALQASEARYRTLFENVPVGVYRSTPEGQLLDVNPAMVEMMGYPDRESFLATTAAERYLNPEDRRRWQDLMARDGVVRDFEKQNPCYDGRVIWTRGSTHPVLDGDGCVLYYEGVTEDITERKRAEEERERLVGELQEALDNVKTLRGLIPICAKCKKIRDEEGYWHQVEVYVRDHTEAQFTHGLCADCFRELYPDYAHLLEE